ncbi:MAG TPA: tetratricopeptide repeat protein [Nitrospiria bacterium]|jgi:hypothetical protein|nr:tetratricopeptide repeat protein [Nitrospiria bacterium]
MEKVSGMNFHRWSWLIPLLLALAFNLNVLQNGFGWDDEWIIPHLKSPDDWMDLFLPDKPPPHSPKSAYLHFRPLTTISYLLDHEFWGDRPFGFHLSVWLAHILNSALVFFLARDLSNRSAPMDAYIPPLAASLFAVHPVHAEAVAWIAGRNDVFCTSFLLASLLLYLRFHRTERRVLLHLSMLAFFGALLIKEIAVGLIVLFPLVEFLETDRGQPVHWRRLALRSALPLAILVAYFWMRSATLQFLPGGSSSSETLSISVLPDIVRAYGFYLDRMLVPYPHKPFITGLPASDLFWLWSAFTLALLMAGLLLAVVRRQALLGMGLGWTVIFILPAAGVSAFHLAATPGAERYVYAPSAGFLVVSAWLLLKGSEKLALPSIKNLHRLPLAPSHLLVIAFTTCIVGLWGWQSWHRNTVWRSPLTFWEAAVSAAPEAGFPHRLLGIQYVSAGRYSEAEEQFRQAIANFQKTLGPRHLAVADSLFSLANVYNDQGKYGEAEPLYLRVITTWKQVLGPDHPDVATALQNLALLYQAQGRYAEAEPLYRKALGISERALKPNDPRLGVLLEDYARLLRSMRRDDEALGLESRAREILAHQPPD